LEHHLHPLGALGYVTHAKQECMCVTLLGCGVRGEVLPELVQEWHHGCVKEGEASEMGRSYDPWARADLAP